MAIRSSAPARIASVLSDVLAVIMITGNIAVSSRSRILRHTAYPSGCGITTSSITRSGLADATSSSALLAVGRGDDVVAARREHGLEQPHVRSDVVHDEDPGVAAHPSRPSQCCRTIPISSRTFTGFDT